MDKLKVRRVGGFAGFGIPGSRLESSGERAFSELSAADQAAVEALFRNPTARRGSEQERDTFRYRITRTVKGQDQTVEVPESAVPQALKACVSDKLT
jgi:emfourin